MLLNEVPIFSVLYLYSINVARAAAYMKIEKYQKALEDCTEAVRLNPKYAKVYMRMGLAVQIQWVWLV